MDVLVFDVNETLLDFAPLNQVFADVFGDSSAREEWFNTLLVRAFTTSLSGTYRDFRALGRSALLMLGEKRAIPVGEASVERILETLATLPAHKDVLPALGRLHDAGFTITALTQSPPATLERQMTNAGLRGLFSRLFSVDAVKRYKPDAAAYRMVAAAMGCAPGQLRLIAAHAWDVEGAMRAGCKAAFVARPGQVLDPESERPDIVGANLDDVATALLACR